MQKDTHQKIAVIGLGYVGLPLALLFLSQGFEVIGIDTDKEKIEIIKSCKSYLSELTDDELIRALNQNTFKVSSSYELLDEADVIILCIPTPLSEKAEPDLTYLIHAAESLTTHLKSGQLIILESSTYPGTTREVLLPIFEKTGLTVGKDIYLAYSPERIDPGLKEFVLKDIPKVVSGITDQCLKKAVRIYSCAFQQIIEVTSPEIAEMAKLLENSYRFINISFINEVSILCDLLKINVWEVIYASSTKPFGFTPFYPGPGIGGHCIPVDPLYLKWKINQAGENSKFIDAANQVNKQISTHIVRQIEKVVSDSESTPKNKNILICGVTYKRDVNDIRESPSLQIIEALLKKGTNVSFYDPFVDKIFINGKKLSSIKLTDESLRSADCVVILTDHSCLPIQKILDHSSVVFDTRNATSGKEGVAKVYYLGGGEL
ncbi:nucleotide sugar dehydrogenase [Cytobacillus firmus]|nr:nucleotide sugar dehydrogenase [Cytobacillus firmus]